MLRPLEVLESVAQIICDLSEARTVSLYLPLEDGHGRPLLVHHGDGVPVPELADEDAAEGFHRHAAAGALNGSLSGSLDGSDGPLLRMASREPGGLVIGIGGGRLAGSLPVGLPPLAAPAGLPVLWVGLCDPGAALFNGRGGGEVAARVLGSLAGLAYCGQLSSAALVDPLQGRTAFRSALDRLVRTTGPPDAGPAAGDRLSGIFTAEDGRDYRNMLLLWDAVTILASSGDLEALARRLVEKVCATFDLDRAALYLGGDDRPLVLLAARRCEAEAPVPAALELIVRANRTRRLAVADNAADAAGGPASVRCAVPLVSGDGCRGFLLLESSRRRLRIDGSERILLEALGGQIGVAVDRIDRQRRERRRQLQERETLQSELSELRRALHHSKLAYCSPRMEELIEVARRVAPTEATVLILGESGSGKELVARTVHRLSRRGDRPPVVVDCGAIAATLIDRELFGHERGAFTGAERGAPGRLAAADGGTIILDEIGELPLEVQSKLLRFVQEKQVTPVGGTRSLTIDARVIAITHRELAAEVAAGSFREDLYHRLNVVRLEVPPLRERPEDVELLARIFLERFVVQYQKDVRELDPDAERALRAHTWPGNVRELQNRVTQAVILATGPRITTADLGLPAAGYRLAQAMRPPVPAPAPVPSSEPVPVAARRSDGVDEAWSDLGLALRGQVAAADPEARRLFPLGRWLADDLVLAAHATASGTICQAAARLGLPESTFRRRYRKASAKRSCGLDARAPGWHRVRDRLADLLREDRPEGSNVLRRARHLLLAEVHDRFPLQTAAGAALMGVTEVTYRRWVARMPH